MSAKTSGKKGRHMRQAKTIAVVLCALALACKDESSVETEPCGFRIGASKEQTFASCQECWTRGELVSISPSFDRESLLQKYPWLENQLTLEEAELHWSLWTHWDVWQHGNLLRMLVFSRGVLDTVGLPGKPGSLWSPLSSVVIEKGQTYDQVFAELRELQGDPSYANIKVNTGWIALREPDGFEEQDFRFLQDMDEWKVNYKGVEQVNLARLRFEDGKLAEVHRMRSMIKSP